jgi:hypothetical protein
MTCLIDHEDDEGNWKIVYECPYCNYRHYTPYEQCINCNAHLTVGDDRVTYD